MFRKNERVRIVRGLSFLLGQTATVLVPGVYASRIRLDKSKSVELIPNGHLVTEEHTDVDRAA